MSRATRTLIALVAVVLQLSSVLAQSDETLLRYEAALANLQQSVEMLPSDAGASLDALASADAALRRLSQDTASTSLIDAMERVFDNARSAVRNRSSADLAVQTAVLRGGFQRGLLEASLDAEDPSDALPGVNRLAGDLGLDVAAMDAIANATDLPSLLRHYQSGVARGVAQRIELAASQLDDSLETSYVTLAGAYGMFLSLQDSPHAPAGLNDDFLALVDATVSGDNAEVAVLAGELSSDFATLGDALAAAAMGTAPDAAAQQADPAGAAQPAEPEPDVEESAVQEPATEEPADVEPETDAVQAETEPAPAAPEEAQAAPPAQEPADPQVQEQAEPAGPAPAEALTGVAGDTPDAAEEAPPPEAGAPTDLPAIGQPEEPAAPSPQDIAAAGELFRQQERDQRSNAMMAELARFGLRGQPAEASAGQLADQGFESVAEAVDLHYSLAARFADAVSRGEQLEARGHLDALSGLFGNSLSPVLTRTAPDVAADTGSLIDSLRASPSLRQSDARALLEQVSTVEAGLRGAAPGMLNQAQAGTTDWFGGWPRMLVIILLALLAILPLVLLRIAFGTGNRNWTLIGSGLFLLLLPLMLDGLGQLAALVGTLAGIDTLHAIASWLTLDTPLGEALWLLFMLLAILLLSIGLYGICRQFGLFGGTEPGQRTSRKRAAKPETKTLVDWDEDF